MKKNAYHHGDLKNALIQAGIEILASEGVNGLSLRKVARKAGVSHAAPYAHFADKQALIAAISTEGFRQLYEQVSGVAGLYQGQAARQLVETAWAYLQFAQADPARFKVMFSGVLESEKNYPEFVAISQQNFQLLVDIVTACQAAGVLRAASADLLAVSVWSLVHGMVALTLENQISHAMFEHYGLKEMLVASLNQMALATLPS